MEFITSGQLNSYEGIIGKIQCEHERNRKLRNELEEQQNKLILSSLSKSNNSSFKLAQVNVKIFSDIVDLLYLYHNEINIPNSLVHDDSSKFYLVEIIITNSLCEKLKHLHSYLNICIDGNGAKFCKTVEITGLEMPILEVVAVDKSVIDCRATAALIFKFEHTIYVVQLDTVSINISYHFEMNKKHKFLNKSRQILELMQSYNKLGSLKTYKPLTLEYHCLTNLRNNEFIQKFIENCYHKVDLEIFSELSSESKSDFLLKFRTGLNNKHIISFDKKTGLIILKGMFLDLPYLKNYFFDQVFRNIKNNDKAIDNFKKLSTSLAQCKDVEDLCTVYKSLRKFWSKPVWSNS